MGPCKLPSAIHNSIPCSLRAAMTQADGFLRVVFLAHPDELREIYALVADFTRDYLNG